MALLAPPHFGIEIRVDGQLAAYTTEDDAPLFEDAYRQLWPMSLIELIDPKAEQKAKAQARQVFVGLRTLFGGSASLIEAEQTTPAPIIPEPVQPIVPAPLPIEPVLPIVLPHASSESAHDFAARLTEAIPDPKRFPLVLTKEAAA